MVWYEYGSGLYNTPFGANEDVLEQLWSNCKRDVHELDLLESKLRTAIPKIKSWKAPGIDGIKGKLIKGGDEAVACIHIMHKNCNKIWATGKFPVLWTKSLVVTIPKKGDTTKCLICHSSKMILEIIRKWMKNDMRIDNGRGTSHLQTR